MLDTLQASPLLFAAAVALFGLLVGSFLNVVAYRLPIMMQLRWREECDELMGSEAPDVPSPFNLSVPRSACPKCGHQITAAENIPVISYLLQGGKCRGCSTRISVQYPAVELLTGIVSIVVAMKFGFTWQCLFALILCWTLIALAMIDLKTQLLPDDLTLPLLWLGIIVNIPEHGLFTDLKSSVIGAVAGYLILWIVFQVFKLITGKEGMGYGDFKLLGALGAWMGWQVLPMIILLSSLVGTVVGIALALAKRKAEGAPIPFGPFLAAAGFIALIWGEQLTRWYFTFTGIG